MKALVLLFVLIGSSFATRLISSDEITDIFTDLLRGTLKHDDPTFLDLVEILQRSSTDKDELNNWQQRSSGTRMTLDCLVCRSAFQALFTLVNEGYQDSELVGTVGFLCTVLGIESGTVCDGVIDLNLPVITYIIRNTPEAAPATFCGLVMQNAQNPDVCPYDDPRFEFTVELPPVPEEPVTPEFVPSEPLTIALVSDAHIDPLYEAYGVAECGEPTCCRKGQTLAQHYVFKSNIDESVIAESIVKENGDVKLDLDKARTIRQMRSVSRTRYPANRNAEPAGYWGDYRNCDTPIWAYEDVIDRIAEAHPNVDIVYFLGDTIDHGVWETSYELINDMNRLLIDKIRNTLGDHVKVVPTIGNHEAQPTNQFAPSTIAEPGLNTTWLYDALAEKWGHYLTDEAKLTLRERGDFSVEVAPGLQVISLNNNVAYVYNWWLVYDPLEQRRQLEWLASELAAAERRGVRVHILTHIPPGVHDLAATWTRQYRRIVNRFSSTIAAEFNGHTHTDEFKIFYDDGGAPASVAWGIGAATAYTFYNLNYKIATLDPTTFELTSMQNYVYNLTEANLTPHQRPHWFQLYDLKNTFGLTDLSVSSMDNLVHRMVTSDRHFLQIYAYFFSKLSDSRMSWCGENCWLDYVCRTVITVLWERQKCEELVALYRQQNSL